ncbi:MAG: hypothetical protein D4R44_04025 [Actinobacteria bacterium]|nr:MAG: hypothetical protein D4R44_04025 [Actinomycetota bacterium]
MQPMLPMAGTGMPGMGQNPIGPDPQAMEAMSMLQAQPSPHMEDETLNEATDKLGIALSRIHLRSPRAAKHLAKAIEEIQSARDMLLDDQSGPMAPPPNLMGNMSMGNQGPTYGA